MDFDTVWERIKGCTELKTFVDLANAVDVQQPAISKRRKSGQFPPEWIFVIAEKFNLSSDFIAFGYQPGQQDDNRTATPQSSLEAPHPQQNQPERTIEEELPKQRLLEMTDDILESETVYRAALASNIRAFHQAVEKDKEEMEIKKEVGELRKMMEKMMAMQIEALSARAEQDHEKKSQAS